MCVCVCLMEEFKMRECSWLACVRASSMGALVHACRHVHLFSATMFVCICVSKRQHQGCTHMHYVCMHVYVCVCVGVCVCACACACECVPACGRAHSSRPMCARAYVCMCAPVHVSICQCVYVSTCVCVCGSVGRTREQMLGINQSQ